MSEEDRVLVARILAGDGLAFDELIRPLEPGLRAFLKSRLRTRTDADVEEALQEVRIYLYRRLDRYLPEYPMAVYARGLALNIARRFLARKSDLAPGHCEDDEDGEWREDLSQEEMQSLPDRFQAVLGRERFDAPDRPPPSREFLEIFEVFLRAGGYPHQQVSFGYSILLWGRSKEAASAAEAGRRPAKVKVPVTGDPDRVVREIGPEELGSSGPAMIEDVKSSLRLSPGYVSRVRKPLDARLAMTGAELFERNATSRKLFDGLATRPIRSTRLNEYFGKDERKSVSDWTRSVKERIRKCIVDPPRAGKIALPPV